MKSTITAPVAEIYSAIQGEGPIVGLRQLFIRFYNCNISCFWCDTPASHKIEGPCFIEEKPGSRNNSTVENPLPPRVLLENILHLLAPNHHSLSLTGGEPLLYHNFLLEFLPMFKKQKIVIDNNIKVYLETNGILYNALKKILPWIDIIGMDWKLSSSTQEQDYNDQHRRFLKRAKECETFVKIVVTADTLEEELARACSVIAIEAPETSIIIQPVTPIPNLKELKPPTPEQVFNWQSLALQYAKEVRVIPQTHVILRQH